MQVPESKKQFLIAAYGFVDGKLAPVRSVPTGSRLYWLAAPIAEWHPASGFVHVLLRRGNELIEQVGPVRVTAGSSMKEELPSLSPGSYKLQIDGFLLGPGGQRIQVPTTEWPFEVKDAGSRAEPGNTSYPLAS